ncbi:hypothetical protein OH779_11295 [Actinacidiphila glaucinigra]|uniref:hypothetical protein n=1 Tax=Actinacidiphila glaucinigra TaxID=235986 RepID=UPI003870D562
MPGPWRESAPGPLRPVARGELPTSDRRLFALSAVSAVVAGGALLPATAYAAAPAADGTGTYATPLYTDDMNGSGGRILTGDRDPGSGDRDGDGYGGDRRTHPVCFAAPCEP